MYTIGEFSKICQVSVKTLHHYDRIGLLTPFRVDSFTGYRYYTKDQVQHCGAGAGISLQAVLLSRRKPVEIKLGKQIMSNRSVIRGRIRKAG